MASTRSNSFTQRAAEYIHSTFFLCYCYAAMQEAVALLTGAFANVNIKLSAFSTSSCPCCAAPLLCFTLCHAAMQEAVALLTGAFANVSIRGNKVGLPAVNQMPAFALRENAGGVGKAGKAVGECWLAAAALLLQHRALLWRRCETHYISANSLSGVYAGQA